MLLLGGEALSLVEHHFSLLPGFFSLLRLRDRCDELGAPTAFQNLLGRLPLGVQLPVPLWALVGRVQDGMVEKRISHNDTPSEEDSCNGSGVKFNFKISPKIELCDRTVEDHVAACPSNGTRLMSSSRLRVWAMS